MKKNGLWITRRDFLKTASAGLALTLAGRAASLEAKDEPDLVVVSGDPATATRAALEAMGGISRFVQKGKRVVLKPNMSFSNPPRLGFDNPSSGGSHGGPGLHRRGRAAGHSLG